MRRFFLQPFEDVIACLEQLLSRGRPAVVTCTILAAAVVAWVIYVPIHELLHALGCVITGGTVTELQIAPQYGGALLARWFPFVVSGGEYAGRLSGFDTKGSDLSYLATDFMPFVLSILVGVPLLRICARRRRPALFAVGAVVGLAPFYNLAGDYFEMGSIVTTRVVTFLNGRTVPVAFEGIRSDDVFKLIGELCTNPGALGLAGWSSVAAGASLICVSLVVGVAIAFATYALGDCLARVIVPEPPKRRA